MASLIIKLLTVYKTTYPRYAFLVIYLGGDSDRRSGPCRIPPRVFFWLRWLAYHRYSAPCNNYESCITRFIASLCLKILHIVVWLKSIVVHDIRIRLCKFRRKYQIGYQSLSYLCLGVFNLPVITGIRNSVVDLRLSKYRFTPAVEIIG